MKNIVFFLMIMLAGLPCSAKTITGEVAKQTRTDINQIYDSNTHIPIEGVLIKIPSKNYVTKTDKNGSFQLGTSINAPAIMSLEKSGYKPYSMTLGKNFNDTINIGIEKTTGRDIVIDTDMIHIGDNSFSDKSANASEFSIKSAGSFYSKDFNIRQFSPKDTLFLIIGSIIGIDTIQAQSLGQSNVLTAYSSSPEIFFNDNKIAEVKINGDNQKINIPYNLVRFNKPNNITIKTGRNLYKTSAIDFDDIEFTNLLLEIK